MIHNAECVTNSVPGRRILTLQEQSSAYDFKALVCCHWFPNSFHTPEGMLNGSKCRFSCFAADLDLRFRDGSNNDTVITGACSLCDFLDKCDEVIVRTCWKPVNSVDLFGISYELIHKDQAVTAFIEQILQIFRSRRNAFSVGIADDGIQVRPSGGGNQLVSHFSPNSIYCISGKIRRILLSRWVHCCTD